MPQYNTVLKLVVTILLYSIVGGCTSSGPSKPNTAHQGSYPISFNELSAKNSLLAQEIAKLPEIKNGISKTDATALEKLCSLYAENPESFDAAFKQMYQIGIPEIRKYCSPLQAVFWLALDGKLEAEIITEYSLHALLSKAWIDDYKSKIRFSELEKNEILDGIKDDNF
jgi:hypothetical protein